MSEHTPEPWEIWEGVFDESNDEWIQTPHVYSAEHMCIGNIICETPTQYPNSMASWEANFHRIVLCVNACRGIPTERLEAIVRLGQRLDDCAVLEVGE